MTKICGIIVLFAISLNTFAVPVVLDFSSGEYSASNDSYTEDGVIVSANNGFHSTSLGTLAWYETNNLISVSANGGLFNLESLDIESPAFFGLKFESSKGGIVTAGSSASFVTFSGEDWGDISFFTVSTILNSADILNQIDNISLTFAAASVPEPSPIALFAILFVFLLMGKNKQISHKIKLRP